MIARKTAKEISDLVVEQMEAQFSIVVALLPKSFIRVLAKVIGGIFVLLYEYCGFILLQMFIKTAVNKTINVGGKDINPLRAWGESLEVFIDLGIRADLEISIPVTTTGGSLTSGTRFANTSTGVIYTLIGDVSLSASTVTGYIRSTTIGANGNIDPGGIVSFVNAPSNCGKDCVVTDITTEGADEEETEHYRNRIAIRWAYRPQGGAYADYWDWASAVPGVKNCYPYSGWDIDGLPNSGSGTVVLFIESASGTDGIPTEALREDVLDAIQNNVSGLANRRPINAYTDLALVRPIVRKTVNVSVGTLIANDVDATKAEILAGLTDYMLSREPFITGISIMPRKDIVSVADLIMVSGRIAAANNGIALNVSFEIDSTPIEDYYQLQEGEKAKLGTLSWT